MERYFQQPFSTPYFSVTFFHLKCFSLLVVLFWGNQLIGQDTSFQVIDIPINNKYFTTDALGNLYVISEKDEVIKYNPSGEATYRYSHTALSEPSFIDATDPFNILVFYKDYQTVVLLDRTMTTTNVINLVSFDFFNVNTVGVASDNKIWLYDEVNFQLKRIDKNGKTVQASDDLSLLLNGDIQANFILEREQKVFVNVPKMGILVFDFMGQYVKTMDFKDLPEFQILRKRLFFQTPEFKYCFFDLQSLLINEIRLPKKFIENKKVMLQQGTYYSGSPTQIQIIKIL